MHGILASRYEKVSIEDAAGFSQIPDCRTEPLTPPAQPQSDALPKIRLLPKGTLYLMTGPGGRVNAQPSCFRQDNSENPSQLQSSPWFSLRLWGNFLAVQLLALPDSASLTHSPGRFLRASHPHENVFHTNFRLSICCTENPTYISCYRKWF